MQKQEEQYMNVTASQRRGLEADQNGQDEWVQKQKEQYVNVTASQRGGQESDEDPDVAYKVVSHIPISNAALYDAVRYS